jgi:plasmid maintenance system antidote protein VapI
MANDLEHQLRQAIRDWGGSLYNLAAISGVPYSQIHRFMSEERSLTLPVAGRLAAALGLELRPAKRSTRNK